AGTSGGDGDRDRQAGRFRHVPGCWQHHQLGGSTSWRVARTAAAPYVRKRGMMMAAAAVRTFVDTLPSLRGRVQADAPLAPFTWFRVGGPAEALVRPSDAADLAQFLRALPPDVPVHAIGACSNLIIRDGGLPGVVLRLARGFSTIAAEADAV